MAWLEIKSFVDFCGVAGLFVSLIGLAVVWKEAREAKTAAQQASAAATQMRDDLNRFDVVKSLSETLTAFEEIKTLQRYGVWELLPQNYSDIRKALLSIKRMAPNLNASHRRHLQSAIQTCSSIEDEIEVSLSLNQVPSDVPRFNRTLTGHVDEVHDVLLHVRDQIGN